MRRVEYKKVAHQASTEVYEARDEQLRVRLWELGLIHDALLKIDERIALSNVAEDHKKHRGLTMFANKLAVQEPGSISFAGHSFGAATMVQFVKSTFYRSGGEDPNYRPLFTPSDNSSIVKQVTPASPVILLDLWTLPIQSPATTWLRKHPMPCYHSREGGSSLLAILSEAFYKWSTNLNETKKIVAKPTSAENPNKDQPGPHIFYPISSAHLSQSDFGVLFPWLTTKVFGAKEPERVLRLNARAILQLLRNNKIEVASTSAEDLEVSKSSIDQFQDEKILSKTKDSVRGWVNLGTDPEARVNGKVIKGPMNAVVEGEVLGEMMKDQGR
jgi:platelet-activating factor acetylhydrolase